jgi:DNA-binding GntR family transcriptional regulator
LLESNVEHRGIVAALKAKDGELSYRTSFGHVLRGKERMLTSLDDMTKNSGEGGNASVGEVA